MMARTKQYATAAERQAAYRERKKGNVTNVTVAACVMEAKDSRSLVEYLKTQGYVSDVRPLSFNRHLGKKIVDSEYLLKDGKKEIAVTHLEDGSAFIDILFQGFQGIQGIQRNRVDDLVDLLRGRL